MPALLPPALADQGNSAEVSLQGFVQFRVRGEPVHLDVDALNEQLQAAGKTRLRQFMRPDEALGVIISFDNVVCPMAGKYTMSSCMQALRCYNRYQLLHLLVINAPGCPDLLPCSVLMDCPADSRSARPSAEGMDEGGF